MLRILHYSTDDNYGGASSASYAIHRLLVDAGHDSNMVVLRRRTFGDETVSEVGYSPSRMRWARLSALFRAKNRAPRIVEPFNFDVSQPLKSQDLFLKRPGGVDLVCFHWITGFLSSKDIRRISLYYGVPVLFLMNDQQHITGGCHYSLGCHGYAKRCGCCPVLKSDEDHDESRRVWLRKEKNFRDLPIVLWCGSSGSAKKADASSLFGSRPRMMIPAPIDECVNRPIPRSMAREILKVPQGRRVLFFGANTLTDARKGVGMLVAALNECAARLKRTDPKLQESIHVIVAGHLSDVIVKQLPFSAQSLGFLRDPLSLALAYQAADVFVSPSTDDEGPMMVTEAMLCGTPVVAFPVGIALDLIQTGVTGHLCERVDIGSLAAGIEQMLHGDAAAVMAAATRAMAVSVQGREIFLARFCRACSDIVQNGPLAFGGAMRS